MQTVKTCIHSYFGLLPMATATEANPKCLMNLLTILSYSLTEKLCLQNSILFCKKSLNLIWTTQCWSLFLFGFCVIDYFDSVTYNKHSLKNKQTKTNNIASAIKKQDGVFLWYFAAIITENMLSKNMFKKYAKNEIHNVDD